jgi:hypothetical protein
VARVFHAAILLDASIVLAANPLSVTVEAERVAILTDDQLMLTYRYNNVPYKPYVKQWRSPSGVNILRDAPHDHVHHHALMFALMVDDVDFWGEVNAKSPGLEAHRGLTGIRVDRRHGMNRAAFTEKLDWTASTDQKVLLQERRTIQVYQAVDLRASLLTWQSELNPPAGKPSAEISGRPYFGLGMRFIQSMDLTGHFINADGKTGHDGTNDMRSKWCAYTATADGAWVTVAMFDHPDNLRYPARWFTMLDPFSYVSATLDVHRKSITLMQGQTLRLRYGLALWDGRIEPEQVEQLYRRWLSLTATTTQPGT